MKNSLVFVFAEKITFYHSIEQWDHACKDTALVKQMKHQTFVDKFLLIRINTNKSNSENWIIRFCSNIKSTSYTYIHKSILQCF